MKLGLVDLVQLYYGVFNSPSDALGYLVTINDLVLVGLDERLALQRKLRQLSLFSKCGSAHGPAS